jgi:hypothetical protein
VGNDPPALAGSSDSENTAMFHKGSFVKVVSVTVKGSRFKQAKLKEFLLACNYISGYSMK